MTARRLRLLEQLSCIAQQIKKNESLAGEAPTMTVYQTVVFDMSRDRMCSWDEGEPNGRTAASDIAIEIV
jgi:hypothetical protein